MHPTMERRLRFGAINETVLPREAWLDHVRRVEALGYDTFLIRDHVVPDFFGDQLGPLVALAAAAAVTERLRVGTLVLDNDYRHPAILAKELATLDLLSGGRLEIGIGAGWLRSEYDALGLPFDSAGTRIDRLEESLAILRGLFSGEPVSVTREHYRIDGLTNVPRPAQRPHPPLLIGAGKPRMLRLAGREADIVGLLTTSVATGTLRDDPHERTAEAVQRKLALVHEGAAGRATPPELSLIPTLLPTTDPPARAAALIGERGWQGVDVDDVLAMPSLLFGSPERMAETILQRRREYGISYWIVSDHDLEAFAPVVTMLRE